MNENQPTPNNQIKNINSNIQKILDSKFDLFSSNVRLSIILILNSQKKVKITELIKLFNVKYGKLDHHIKILEKENLLVKRISLFSKRALTTLEFTEKGKKLLLEYLESMKEILKEIKFE